MILISHRGNLMGKTDYENNPDYILNAIEEGFNVEIDVWFKYNSLYLGHDYPQFKIDIYFLENKKLWVHAKNYDALNLMLKNNIHCFWHQNDTFTITSNGYIWQYPSDVVYNNSIFLMPENFKNLDYTNVIGLCSDYIMNYKKLVIS